MNLYLNKAVELLRIVPVVLVFAVVTAIPVRGVNAQATAPQACDPDFWRQLNARAWLEAEREIMQNQNLIFKPDSVFEYTCFDNFLQISAWNGGDIFVHTNYFTPQPIPRASAHSMQVALQLVVFESLASYIDRNFEPWELLADRIRYLENGGVTDRRIEDGYIPSYATRENRDYQCDVMRNVWRAAKCMNFMHNATFEQTDGFYPFTEIEGYNGSTDVPGYDADPDIRRWPHQLECQNPPISEDFWENQRNISLNDPERYQFQTPLGQMYQQVRERLEPGQCDGHGIQTGITVRLTPGAGGGGHADGICTNPGCVWQEGGNCG